MPQLLRELKKFYKTSARTHLPWRNTKDPYKILVSELMLQQTQVERVVPFYNKFIKTFPTSKALSKAPLLRVLKLWQGLGYNRRAKYLHEAAKVIAQERFNGQKLPGVGPYTAGAIDAFAYNKPTVFIETNIRTVFFYHSNTTIYRSILDAELLPLVAEALQKSKMQPRDFYAALMDYGSHLKKQGVKLNSRSKHYTKQSKFEGSARQLRGAILHELLKGSKTLAQLTKNLSPRTRGEVDAVLARLTSEGLVKRAQERFAVAG